MEHFSSISDSPEEGKPPLYSREFQEMLERLDEEDYRDEEGSQISAKKRRLSYYQVKALEMNFDVDNKLEPDRKMKLAEELGLLPRQVAIWFQNRRARWKNKQLEKDYCLLKDDYDALKLDYGKLYQQNQAINNKLKDLKAKLTGHINVDDHNPSVKEESETGCTVVLEQNKSKEIYLDDNNNNCNVTTALLPPPSQNMISPEASSSSAPAPSYTTSSPNSIMDQWFHLPSNSRVLINNTINLHHQSQVVRIEDHPLFGGGAAAEDSPNFFSVDQAPTLQWYFTGQ
ncbi:hypothetical protein ACFE04_025648 [Oxalis oulophora]